MRPAESSRGVALTSSGSRPVGDTPETSSGTSGMSFEPFGRLPRGSRHRLKVRGIKGSLWFHSTGSHCLTSDYAQDEFDPAAGSGDAFDDPDDLVDAVAVATREFDELAGLVEHCTAFGCAGDRDAAATSELEQTFIA